MRLLSSFLLAALVLIGTGMSCSHLKKGEASASNFRLFWVTEGFEFEATTNSTRIKLQKSNTDNDAIRAAAEGGASGATGK